ncbi:Diacylglycerol O-acyltransferase [Plasmodiophora brassicae]
MGRPLSWSNLMCLRLQLLGLLPSINLFVEFTVPNGTLPDAMSAAHDQISQAATYMMWNTYPRLRKTIHMVGQGDQFAAEFVDLDPRAHDSIVNTERVHGEAEFKSLLETLTNHEFKLDDVQWSVTIVIDEDQPRMWVVLSCSHAMMDMAGLVTAMDLLLSACDPTFKFAVDARETPVLDIAPDIGRWRGLPFLFSLLGRSLRVAVGKQTIWTGFGDRRGGIFQSIVGGATPLRDAFPSRVRVIKVDAGSLTKLKRALKRHGPVTITALLNGVLVESLHGIINRRNTYVVTNCMVDNRRYTDREDWKSDLDQYVSDSRMTWSRRDDTVWEIARRVMKKSLTFKKCQSAVVWRSLLMKIAKVPDIIPETWVVDESKITMLSFGVSSMGAIDNRITVKSLALGDGRHATITSAGFTTGAMMPLMNIMTINNAPCITLNFRDYHLSSDHADDLVRAMEARLKHIVTHDYSHTACEA